MFFILEHLYFQIIIVILLIFLLDNNVRIEVGIKLQAIYLQLRLITSGWYILSVLIFKVADNLLLHRKYFFLFTLTNIFNFTIIRKGINDLFSFIHDRYFLLKKNVVLVILYIVIQIIYRKSIWHNLSRLQRRMLFKISN
jgi:hypothetical protein